MSESRKFVCTGCGFVLDRGLDTGHTLEVPISLPAVPTVGLGDDPLGLESPLSTSVSEPVFTIKECEECGKNEWQSVSEEETENDIEPEKPKQAKTPKDKGFQDVIPPSPEVNPADVMFTDTNSKKDPVPKAEPKQQSYKCTECGKEETTKLNVEDLGTCSVCGFSGWGKTTTH